MASKKASEGIALLSMYNDEEDEEMDEARDGGSPMSDKEEGKKELRQGQDDFMESSDREDEIRVSSDRAALATDSGNGRTAQVTVGNNDSSPHQREEVVAVESRRRRREGLTIVDYGHDEVAMSPEPEEREAESSSRVMFDAKLQSVSGEHQEKVFSETMQSPSNSIRVTPHSSDQQNQAQLDTPNQDYIESGASDVKNALEVSENVDPLDKFLLPPPTTKCSEELQERLRKFIALRRAGKRFNAEVRNRKDYRNPDFLLHAVRYQDIDQIGSCFSKDVFDPHGYDPSDYYDELEIYMKRETERKELERKRSQQVDFVSAGTQVANLAAISKINLAFSVPSVTGGVAIRSASAAPDPITREGRQNKKSKWDKVDTGGQDTISATGAHAAPRSAANAGAGYTAFAQQRRREVEEKRSGERKT